MPCELTADAIGQITNAPINLRSTKGSQVALREYGTYALLPPLLSSVVGNMLMHPEVNLNALHTKSHQSDWNDENWNNFVIAVGYPALGYLISYPAIICTKLLFTTTRYERAQNPVQKLVDEPGYCTWYNNANNKHVDDCYSVARILWNIKFTENKSVLPPFDSVINAVAIVFWSAAYSAIYALVGNAVLHNIADRDDAIDLTKTYALGGALLPAIVVTLHLIYRIMIDGELSVFPNRESWQTTPSCKRRLTWMRCRSADTAQPTHFFSSVDQTRAPLLNAGDVDYAVTVDGSGMASQVGQFIHAICGIAGGQPLVQDAVTAARARSTP